MDWIKQNKFLAGFLGVTVAGAGALGFLAFSAKGTYDTARESYTSKVGELNGLLNQQPYPDDESVKKMQGMQKEHQAAIDSLHKELVAAEIPLKPISPEKFQDTLREAVRRIQAKAQEHNTELPKEFYLGYEKYQATPPKPEAAPHLAQMVEAMELVLNTMLDANIVSIVELKPGLLQEEGGAKESDKDKSKDKEKGKGDKDKDKEKLVQRDSFTVQFVAPELNGRSIINGLASSKKQFFIPQGFTIENEQPKGPSKTQPADSTDPTKPTALKYIVGDEKVKMTVTFDIAHFAQPAEPKAK